VVTVAWVATLAAVAPWLARRNATLLFLFIGAMVAAVIAIAYAKGEPLQRRRWIATGCCERCGYDLRASPDRCPECGDAGRE
jgi:hypothetical protein